MIRRVSFSLLLLASLLSSPAAAQVASVIAVPPLATPDRGSGPDSPAQIAWQASQLIASDLRTTAELMPLDPDQKDFYSYPEVTAPTFSKWKSRAKLLLTGFVRSRSDGRLAVGCYVYDVTKGRELDRVGFVFAPENWRRAAHKCSGLAYTAATGAPGIFDTRIAYVAESGPATSRIKRIAVMDSDGIDHKYLTAGDSIVLTPRLSPKGDRVAFVSFVGGQPHVLVADVASGQAAPLLPGNVTSFAPSFSPDGNRIVFSMQIGINTDIYVADSRGGTAQRLTSAPGIDTSPSFSPDGSRILFESDRSGAQQLYVMNSDGSAQRRVSFGGGWYAAPQWSPDGEWVAFVRRVPGAGRRIGVMKADGTGERLLTNGPYDEGASWAPSSRELIYQSTDAAGRSGLYRISLDGSQPRKVTTPQDASDPDWSGVID
ncbi:MAG TPA: Tol-Pal system beta propeller repeat protein TolB [Sphingomicrobium sp.]